MENFPFLTSQLIHVYTIMTGAVIYIMSGITLFIILSEYSPRKSFMSRLMISAFWPLAFFYYAGRRLKRMGDD